LLASLLAFIYTVAGLSGSTFGTFIVLTIYMNLVLMVFNLLPIPPLDGSKFFALFFPALESKKFEMYGPFVLIAFIVVGGTVFIIPVIQFLLKLMGINVAF
jgi:Zn-dependent protease